MKRIVLLLIAAAMCAAGSASAETQTYFGFQIGISNAPPPPQRVFVERPRIVEVEDSPVYVVEQSGLPYDVFCYGSTYYIYNSGYWYRGASYRGPFRVCDVRYVPRPILYVPANHWKHHPHGGPPGQWKKYSAENERHGHGHGKYTLSLHDALPIYRKSVV